MGSKPIGISGSRASAIMGLNKYQTQFEVWQRMMEERQPGFNEFHGFIMPEEPDNAPIRWGNAFEDPIIDLIGEPVHSREKFYSKKYDWGEITCHIDGITESGMMVEAKSTNIFTWNEEWGEPNSDKIPQEYAIQDQHNLLCSGLDECLTPVLVFPKRVEEFEAMGWLINADKTAYFIDNGDEILNPKDWANQLNEMGYYHQYKIKANPDIQKGLLDFYRKWWNDHILKEKPPEAKSYDDILRMLPRANGIVTVEDDQVTTFKKHQKMGKVIKRITTAREQLKIDILSSLPSGAEKDEDNPAKMVFMDQYGGKLGSFNGKQFRTCIKEEK